MAPRHDAVTEQELPALGDPESHPEEATLLEHVEGALSAEDSARIVEHIKTCDRCREVVSALSRSEEGDADRPLIGQRIGDYLVVERLGSGGMNEVYRAENVAIGRKVALKVLNRELSEDPEYVRRLLAEARAVNAISHPDIVDVQDRGTTPDGRHFLVMELLEGKSLDHELDERERLSVDEVLELLQRLAGALDAAHAAGVLHRDLKPGNVFLDRRRGKPTAIKLLDFGLAKLGVDATTPTTQTHQHIVGTPAYMAPEQALGERIDARADLYALGVLAYQALSGELPFPTEPTRSDWVARLTEPPPALTHPTAPKELLALIARLLSPEPKARPASAAEVRRTVAQLRGSRRK